MNMPGKNGAMSQANMMKRHVMMEKRMDMMRMMMQRDPVMGSMPVK